MYSRKVYFGVGLVVYCMTVIYLWKTHIIIGTIPLFYLKAPPISSHIFIMGCGLVSKYAEWRGKSLFFIIILHNGVAFDLWMTQWKMMASFLRRKLNYY